MIGREERGAIVMGNGMKFRELGASGISASVLEKIKPLITVGE